MMIEPYSSPTVTELLTVFLSIEYYNQFDKSFYGLFDLRVEFTLNLIVGIFVFHEIPFLLIPLSHQLIIN